MTKRAALVALCALVLLFCALSTRGALFWLLFWVLFMMLLISLAATLWARATMEVECTLDQAKVTRGTQVALDIRIRHTCPLPIAALRLNLCSMQNSGTLALYASVQPFSNNFMHYQMQCPHVGVFPSGITAVVVHDIFGLFSLRRKLDAQQEELVVLPQLYMMESLAFSPGESDNESVTARAFEDATMPTDLRAFQQGDELKKVHWKLSMRRKELLVRVYDQPQRPDALLLVDCSPPEAKADSMATLQDAICEAAASIASVALQDGAPVRMPLLSDTPMDVSASKPEDIAMVTDALAHCRFDGAQQFERVLLLETRRMRRTGTTAIVTSRMNPVLADMILRIRRMGPKVRVHLTADLDDEMTSMLVARLMRNDVEVAAIEMVRVEHVPAGG